MDALLETEMIKAVEQTGVPADILRSTVQRIVDEGKVVFLGATPPDDIAAKTIVMAALETIAQWNPKKIKRVNPADN